MPTNVPNRRGRQIFAWAIFGIFILGYFFPLTGAWTGAILGVWFVGTQKPLCGFLWLIAYAVPALIANWRHSPLPALQYIGWAALFALLGVLPLTFHRLVSPRLPGFLFTLPLPLASAALRTFALAWFPASIFSAYSITESQRANTPLLQIASLVGIGVIPFLIEWFAATVVWMWNLEFRAVKVALGATLFVWVSILSIGYGVSRLRAGFALPPTPPTGQVFPWSCLAGVLILTVWALLRPGKRQTWADRPQAVALLRSPSTANPIHVVRDHSREALVSSSGEHFPIRNGIPVFLSPQDLTGDNKKYNHLYETIGGFYDDIQRVVAPMSNFDFSTYVMSYLGYLEVKPGDSVLETSVGTGLNFKYLPRGVRLTGLDLSPEMLANCQANLRRWQLDADLFLGNAERLPFADASFDVVFHVGGINFFNDRAKAIREMIRVAKPGTRILIADETEEHVKAAYERGPITNLFYRNRKQPVAPPVDLIPPEMLEIQLEILNVVGKNRFYALTFRKPLAA